MKGKAQNSQNLWLTSYYGMYFVSSCWLAVLLCLCSEGRSSTGLLSKVDFDFISTFCTCVFHLSGYFYLWKFYLFCSWRITLKGDIFRYVYAQTHPCLGIIVTENRDHESGGEWRQGYGRVWREEREGENIIKLPSQKKKTQTTKSGIFRNIEKLLGL